MPDNPIYTTLLAEIQTILETVTNLRDNIYNHPVTKLLEYPAAIYFPTSSENSFETNEQNFKIYNFVLMLVVGTQQIKVDPVWSEVLPNLVDDVMEAFDSSWSLSSINGNRVWIKINSGEWGMSEEQKGLEAWTTLNIEVKLSTNN